MSVGQLALYKQGYDDGYRAAMAIANAPPSHATHSTHSTHPTHSTVATRAPSSTAALEKTILGLDVSSKSAWLQQTSQECPLPPSHVRVLLKGVTGGARDTVHKTALAAVKTAKTNTENRKRSKTTQCRKNRVKFMLMPRKAFPHEECDENGGRGWTVSALNTWRSRAGIEYTQCNFVNPRHTLLKPIWYERDMLQEL